MRLRRTLQRAIAILVLGLGTSTAGANLLTFAVSGSLGNSFGDLHAGDAFTLTYTVDTTVPGTLIFQSGQRTFVSFDNVLSATVRIGSWLASSQGLTREIDDAVLDQYEVFSSGPVSAPSVAGLDVSYFSLQLLDRSGTLVTDAFAPLTSLSPFDENGFGIVFGDVHLVAGPVTSITVVPEPGTLALLIIGCTALFTRPARRAALTPARAQVS